jgi:transposase
MELWGMLGISLDFIPMEDNAKAQKSWFINQEQVKESIPEVEWPTKSSDLNPIEKIWNLMKKRILSMRSKDRVITIAVMTVALLKEWEHLRIEEINTEVAKLPAIMACCIAAKGDNNYHR